MLKSPYSSQVTSTPSPPQAYPGFPNMKRLSLWLCPPRWDASSSQGYHSAFYQAFPTVSRYLFIFLGGKACESNVLLPGTHHMDPKSSALTPRLMRLPQCYAYDAPCLMVLCFRFLWRWGRKEHSGGNHPGKLCNRLVFRWFAWLQNVGLTFWNFEN